MGPLKHDSCLRHQFAGDSQRSRNCADHASFTVVEVVVFGVMHGAFEHGCWVVEP